MKSGMNTISMSITSCCNRVKVEEVPTHKHALHSILRSAFSPMQRGRGEVWDETHTFDTTMPLHNKHENTANRGTGTS